MQIKLNQNDQKNVCGEVKKVKVRIIKPPLVNNEDLKTIILARARAVVL